MSRPWSSVPSRYLVLPSGAHDGGRRASLSTSVERSNGLCGAIHPAKTEQITQTSAMAAARRATGEVRKLDPVALSSQPNSFVFISGLCEAPPGLAAAASSHQGLTLPPLTDIHLK